VLFQIENLTIQWHDDIYRLISVNSRLHLHATLLPKYDLSKKKLNIRNKFLRFDKWWWWQRFFKRMTCIDYSCSKRPGMCECGQFWFHVDFNNCCFHASFSNQNWVQSLPFWFIKCINTLIHVISINLSCCIESNAKITCSEV